MSKKEFYIEKGRKTLLNESVKTLINIKEVSFLENSKNNKVLYVKDNKDDLMNILKKMSELKNVESTNKNTLVLDGNIEIHFHLTKDCNKVSEEILKNLASVMYDEYNLDKVYEEAQPMISLETNHRNESALKLIEKVSKVNEEFLAHFIVRRLVETKKGVKPESSVLSLNL